MSGPVNGPVSDQERDIQTARQFYGDLLAIEVRIEEAIRQMHNRGRWLEARSHLWRARESLQLFIGERMTADIVAAHWQALEDASMPPEE